MNWIEKDLFGLNGKNWELLQHSYLLMPQCDYNNILPAFGVTVACYYRCIIDRANLNSIC